MKSAEEKSTGTEILTRENLKPYTLFAYSSLRLKASVFLPE
jgi:hypothetical protein